ncbi:MAG: hypothetical protein WCJ09_01130 [Planctomycetota bacterium]
MDHETANAPTQKNSDAEPDSRFQIGNSAIVYPALGCLGWLAVIPFLDPLGTGDPLSQFFQGFFNLILIGVIGGPATILSFVGLSRSRKELKSGNASVGKIGKRLSIVAFVIGVGVLLMYLPSPLILLR